MAGSAAMSSAQATSPLVPPGHRDLGGGRLRAGAASESGTTWTTAIEATERVGSLEMRVMVAAASDATVERWTSRAEVLAAWLAAEWRREQRAEATS